MSQLRVLRRPGRTSFAGNDYLGLATEPRMVEALAAAARQHGISATSSRWALGWTDLYAALESRLAEFFGADDAVIFGATYLAGPAYFGVMAETHGGVYCYENSHSNLFTGIRAAGLELRTFAHGDLAGLERMLAAHRGRPAIVATDGVYSISGQVPPLAEMSALARRHGAELLIDDAHGVFAVGPTGRGAAELCGVEPGEATIMGSMSKALGCNGGFLCGARDIVDKVRRSAPAAGSALPPPPIAAACLEGLRIVSQEPQRRLRMQEHARTMREVLRRNGISIVADRTPIIAMVLRDEAQAADLADHFLAHDIVIPYFKYPSEPRHNLLRSVARSCYTDADMARFTRAVETWPGRRG